MTDAATFRLADTDLKARDARLRLESLSRLLDSAVTIPGTRVPVGLDAVLAVVPVAGSTVSAAVSSYLVYEAARLGASKRDIARMLGNVGVDYVLGSIPVIGVVFDIFFRANDRNMRILRDHIDRVDGVIDHSPNRSAGR